MTSRDYEEADRLGRRRAQMLPLLAVIFIAQQGSFFARPDSEHLQRSVDWVKGGMWLLLSLVILAALWTGGFWLKRRAVRALMDDEVTQANRAKALSLAFLVAMLMAMGVYVLNLWSPLGTREALHLVVSAGLVTGLVRFGMLERRAYADG